MSSHNDFIYIARNATYREFRVMLSPWLDFIKPRVYSGNINIDKMEGRMSKVKKIGTIIGDYLREHNFDGLYLPGECSCSIDDLFPCDSICDDCISGYKIECDHKSCNGDYSFCIGESHDADCPFKDE